MPGDDFGLRSLRRQCPGCMAVIATIPPMTKGLAVVMCNPFVHWDGQKTSRHV